MASLNFDGKWHCRNSYAKSFSCVFVFWFSIAPSIGLASKQREVVEVTGPIDAGTADLNLTEFSIQFPFILLHSIVFITASYEWQVEAIKAFWNMTEWSAQLST